VIPSARPPAPAPPPEPPRLWPVFAAYVLAFVGIVAFNLVALSVVHELYPELPEREMSLPALLAGGFASAMALLVTLLAAVRPFDPRRLRLLPGRETGPVLVLIIAGTLALGQTLDSATVLAGLAERSAMADIRRVLEGAAGGELFAAVLVIGPVAGAAEEIFFRGFMQTALAAVWRPRTAVIVSALAFALLHVEPVHAVLALALGLWFGAVTERTGSVLPAAVAHVVNNVLYTLLTALALSIDGVRPNLLAGALALAVFVAAVAVLRRRV